MERPRGDPARGVSPGGCWIRVFPCRALSCGCHRLPTGLEDVSKYPALVAELLARNWTEQEVRAALADNLLRVFKKVEMVSGAAWKWMGQRDALGMSRALGCIEKWTNGT